MPKLESTLGKLVHTIALAEQRTDYSRSYLYEQIKLGRLKSFKKGNRTYVTDEALRKMIYEDYQQGSIY